MQDVEIVILFQLTVPVKIEKPERLLFNDAAVRGLYLDSPPINQQIEVRIVGLLGHFSSMRIKNSYQALLSRSPRSNIVAWVLLESGEAVLQKECVVSVAERSLAICRH